MSNWRSMRGSDMEPLSPLMRLLGVTEHLSVGQRCATCKMPVDISDERWRFNGRGWEHLCPGDTNVVRIYNPSEEIPTHE